MLVIISFFIAHWYLSLFTQTFFHHRYAAHGTFTMSRFWEKFFHVVSFVFQGSSYLSPYAYGVMHRLHHAYADTEKDPHSPKYDKNIFTMMWRTRGIYKAIDEGTAAIDPKFTKGVPKWRAFDRFAENGLVRSLWVVLYIVLYYFYADQWWLYVLIPIHAVMGPFHGVIINWFAHKYGYRNFEVKDTSMNLMPVDVLMLGEGLHNNHHKYGGRAKFSVKWFEFDPVYPIIWFFDKIGIIKIKKKDPLDYMG
ncbi:acyl-CoA desaturase [Flavobacteriaceae bacterium Ap0902]|nr:acyl-CoA desaturase [Flavobacteriaceae bacterium Ap0902]